MNLGNITQRVNAEINELKASLDGCENTYQKKSLETQIEVKTGALANLTIVDKHVKEAKATLEEKQIESKGDVNLNEKKHLDDLRKVRKYLVKIATAEVKDL